jgi:hypothetical protein
MLCQGVTIALWGAVVSVQCLRWVTGGRGAAEAFGEPSASRPTTLDVPPNAAESSAAGPLLETLERKAFDYFWQEADPKSGLVKDRASNAVPDDYTVASLAATGFGLAALPVGVERGWITRAQGQERARTTLRFARDRLAHQHGWLYHFVDFRTGQRVWSCEVSTIDTALFMAGTLVAGRYFRGTEVAKLADGLYRRLDFDWMRTDGGAKPREKTIVHGWTPEKGFLSGRWDHYDECMILYLLGLGSPAHPLPAASWEAWTRREVVYGEYRGLALDLPLFVHQFSHAFVDFRGKRDRTGFEPWVNSVTATRMNQAFCVAHARRFPAYGPRSWGLSACDGPDGYRAYAPAEGQDDGTLAPWAVVASVPFDPDLCLSTLAAMKRAYDDRLWGRYGFADAYNLGRNWWDKDVIGIDMGAALLMIENHRTGLIWRQFMAIPAIQRALKQAGFQTAGVRRSPPGAMAARRAVQKRKPSPRSRPSVAIARRPV